MAAPRSGPGRSDNPPAARTAEGLRYSLRRHPAQGPHTDGCCCLFSRRNAAASPSPFYGIPGPSQPEMPSGTPPAPSFPASGPQAARKRSFPPLSGTPPHKGHMEGRDLRSHSPWKQKSPCVLSGRPGETKNHGSSVRWRLPAVPDTPDNRFFPGSWPGPVSRPEGPVQESPDPLPACGAIPEDRPDRQWYIKPSLPTGGSAPWLPWTTP